MVGTDNSIKVIGLMVLYFGLMAIIITLVSNLSGTTISTTGGSDAESYEGNWCNTPRLIYEPYNQNPLDITQMTSYEYKHTIASLDCGKTAGVTDSTSCASIDGCTWDAPSSFWNIISFGLFGAGEDTCVGTVDYGINATGEYWGYGENAYTDGEVVATCDYPDVKYNETLCNAFSCTWSYTDGIEDLDINAEQNKGMFKSTMKTIGSMLTLKFDYGFDNATARILLNLLLFWIPLLVMIIAIYQLIPLI